MRRREDWARDRCRRPTVKGRLAPLVDYVARRRLCRAFVIARKGSLRASISSPVSSPKSVRNTLKRNSERINASEITVIISTSTLNQTKKKANKRPKGPDWQESSAAMKAE